MNTERSAAMSINEFMLENNIAIFVEVDVPGKSFITYKSDIELEYYSLYEQLILYSDAENLAGTVEGQIMPRMWQQGNTRCVVCKINEEKLVFLFYDSEADPISNYDYAKELNNKVIELML